jgi:hypothetical protein
VNLGVILIDGWDFATTLVIHIAEVIDIAEKNPDSTDAASPQITISVDTNPCEIDLKLLKIGALENKAQRAAEKKNPLSYQIPVNSRIPVPGVINLTNKEDEF